MCHDKRNAIEAIDIEARFPTIQNIKENKMKKIEKTTNEAKVFKTFDGLDLTKIPGSATEILTTNWDKFNGCKTADDVIALCHELFDEAGLDTEWTNKFFYTLDQIVERNPNPKKAWE